MAILRREPAAVAARRRRPARRAPVRIPPAAVAPLAPLALAVVAALLLLVTYARPLTATVVVGAPDDLAATIGFNDRERNPAGIPYRWTDQESAFVFHAAGLAFPANRPLTVELDLAASRPPGAAPVHVAVSVNGSDAGTQVVGGQAVHGYPAGRGAAGPVDTAVTIRSDTFTPPGDKRVLGVAVLGPARLVQGAGAGPALPPAGAWLRWFGAVALAYLLGLAALRRAWRAGALGLGVALVMTAVALAARVAFWQYVHLALLALGAAALWVGRRDLLALARDAAALAHRRAGIRAPGLAAAGLAAAAIAQVVLTAGRGSPAVAVLYGLGLALVLVALAGHGAGPSLAWWDLQDLPALRGDAADPTAVRPAEWLALAGIVVLAAWARFAGLHDIPFGMWRDEARHGLEALHILQDPAYRPVYVPNISLPGLYPGVIALAFRVFGVGVTTLRGVTAAAGVLTVAALYGVARRLWGPRIAIAAAFLAAVGSWRVSIDRLAFDTAPTTLCTLLAFYCFLRAVLALRTGRRAWPFFALAGLCGALAAYGYYPGRFAAVVLALAVLVLIARHRLAFLRRALPGLALAVVVALLALAPLGAYAVEHPDLFFKRSDQVFILTPEYREGETAVEALERNIGKHLVMFNYRGEPNARHHMPGWPMLDAVTGVCFAAGVAIAIALALGGNFAAAFVLLWMATMLVPSIVSVDAPSAVRAQDAAPAAYLLAALGFVTCWRLLASGVSRPALRTAVMAAAGLALALAAAINLWIYFVRMPGDPRVLGKFYVGEARAGYAVAAARDRDPALVAYVPREYLADETLVFASAQAPLRELPVAGTALPSGPLLLIVPRDTERADFAAQVAAARRVATSAGLREIDGPPPPGGGPPTYVAF
ncbi:MAG TPA: glycosyltransferase family 39 protein, partial [Thermomicrobiales bacterium]|nr:glycosyltransferase family 39 protein [Thermomicrobiales bacterium]